MFLKPRSLLVMSGPSRYVWTHGIVPRTYDLVPAQQQGQLEDEKSPETINSENSNKDEVKYRTTRTSFTFRKILPDKKCACAFPDHCDTLRTSLKSEEGEVEGKGSSSSSMTPWQLEATHVHRVYDEIASHFSSTRHTPWPRVKDFVLGLEEGSAVLDVGCGNGKYFGLKVGAWLPCERS